jgi:IPT/TIG domain
MSKMLFNKQLLSMLCLVMAIGIVTSCKKNTTSASSKVELLSFGPTGAKHGDTIFFIGNNLDRVTAVQLVGAMVPASAFKEHTSQRIAFIIPQSTQEGYAILKTPDGDVVSKTKINFTVIPKITSVTKQARPGDNITITGDFLNWVNEIKFTKDIAETSFVSRTLNQIVVKIPANAKTGTLFISSGGTKPLIIETDSVLIVTLPVVTALSPNPVLHAANLTITGTNLDLAKKVLFTGVATPVTTFVSQSLTQLVVKIPAATQKGKVTLEAASGVQTISSMDLDVALPSVATMAPNPVDPGTNLTITGTNLNLATSITFQNAPAVTTFVSQTATQIVVKVPTGVTRGKITLAVLNSTLTVLSPDILEITGGVPPPTVALPFYDDAITANWTNTGWLGGGWGGTKDLNNTSPVRDGTKSCRIDYVGGYGSPLQLGHNAGTSTNISPYTTFKISIYGAAGSGGKKVNIGINGADAYTITIVEGTWTDYAIPISSLTSASTLTEILVKEYSGSGGFTIYVDDIGLN